MEGVAASVQKGPCDRSLGALSSGLGDSWLCLLEQHL